jgi:hypothetical protein
MCSTTAKSWAINKIAVPRFLLILANKLIIEAWTLTSKAETGSSAMIKSGLVAKALAIPILWR